VVVVYSLGWLVGFLRMIPEPAGNRVAKGVSLPLYVSHHLDVILHVPIGQRTGAIPVNPSRWRPLTIDRPMLGLLVAWCLRQLSRPWQATVCRGGLRSAHDSAV
jgi:hypothetical protein